MIKILLHCFEFKIGLIKNLISLVKLEFAKIKKLFAN